MEDELEEDEDDSSIHMDECFRAVCLGINDVCFRAVGLVTRPTKPELCKLDVCFRAVCLGLLVAFSIWYVSVSSGTLIEFCKSSFDGEATT